jgi:hypothetical protein
MTEVALFDFQLREIIEAASIVLFVATIATVTVIAVRAKNRRNK